MVSDSAGKKKYASPAIQKSPGRLGTNSVARKLDASCSAIIFILNLEPFLQFIVRKKQSQVSQWWIGFIFIT